MGRDETGEDLQRCAKSSPSPTLDRLELSSDGTIGPGGLTGSAPSSGNELPLDRRLVRRSWTIRRPSSWYTVVSVLASGHIRVAADQVAAPAILVNDLAKRCGDLAADGRINFSAAQGEISAFLHPNGTGRSTTVKSSQAYPTASTAAVAGFDVAAQVTTVRRHIGLVFRSRRSTTSSPPRRIAASALSPTECSGTTPCHVSPERWLCSSILPPVKKSIAEFGKPAESQERAENRDGAVRLRNSYCFVNCSLARTPTRNRPRYNDGLTS